MASILANATVKKAIQQIAIRTEREDPENIIDSFYDCNIISHLTNRNHQIIQGRRGTGKTHILLVLKSRLESSECHGIYFDCKATGSAADISDAALPEKHRVIQLIRDFLLYIYKDLLDYFDEALHARGVINDVSITDFMQVLFSDLRSAILLVRASEGNPRDFISIVNCCIVELDGIGDSGSWIDSQVVYNAANDWYHMDKENALSSQQRQFLSELSTYIVRQKRSRGFVLDESYLAHPLIKSLIDARILHVVQTGRFFANLGTCSMAIVVLDFGTYSDILISNEDIHFLTNDYFENAVFHSYNPTRYNAALYNFDETRQFQMCFFDPELSPEICPSFFALSN